MDSDLGNRLSGAANKLQAYYARRRRSVKIIFVVFVNQVLKFLARRALG